MGLPAPWVVVLLAAAGVASVVAPPRLAEAGIANRAHGKTPGHDGRVLELDWRELLPPSEREHFSAVAPPPAHDSRGEGGPPAVQKPDFTVNKSLEGALVRLPGFIVPLEAPKGGSLSEFLLVPYFGSCIHVPPPPPNQLVYVHTRAPLTVESIYEAYWVTGRLHVQTRSTRLGSAAYELSAEKIEVYRY